MVAFILSFISALLTIALVLALGYAGLVVMISIIILIPWWIWFISFLILMYVLLFT